MRVYKKNSLVNGCIYEITLPGEFGVAYGKYLHSVILPKEEVVLSAIKVYNYVGKPLTSLDVLDEQDILFGYKKIAGIIPTLRKGEWKVVGKRELAEEEKVVPDFKRYYPSSPAFEKNAKEWGVIINNDTKSKKALKEQVMHLETDSCDGTGLIEIRIVMEYLRVMGKGIEDYFELKEYYELSVLDDVLSRPLYRDIPLSRRGRAFF